MADETESKAGDGEGAAPKKGKLKLIIIAGAAAVVFIGGGIGAYMMFFRAKHDEHAKVEEKAKPPVYLEVPEVLVNLSTGSGERTQYLKVKIALEVPEQKGADHIKTSLPRVTDMFQTYLRELRSSDLNGSAGLYRLREELTRRVNAAVQPEQVKAVLFKEIVVQ